jgi:CubicO group peptidase (beta-lactamase class C family)
MLAAVYTSAPPIAAQSPGCHSLAGLDAIGNDLQAAFPVTGGLCLQVAQQGQVLYQRASGGFTLQEVVPIASATKTLSAAVLLALVDDGTLGLDDRVGQYLPEWNTGARAAITLRMCFTHTAGLPETDPALGDDTITLRQAAQRLALRPLIAVPGTAFAYGGVSMHVAGAVCEVASGRSWAQLFAQEIAAPLQMAVTDYGAFGPTANPRIAGGARSDLRDFAAFVEMLRQGGVFAGQRVLSAAMVDEMLSDQTSGLPVLGTPSPTDAPYGLGIWLDRRDALGRTVLASAAGAFGFVGWVDRAHDGSGVFVVQNRYPAIFPFLERTWQLVDDALLPVSAHCLGAGSPPCAAGAWLSASLPPRQGQPDFAVLAANVPAGAPGAILLGLPLAAAAPVFDLAAWIDLSTLASAAVLADAAGRARLPLPLVGVPPGAGLGLQAAWLSGDPCTAVGLQASHALSLVVAP